jgi:hypothetical protein
VRTASPVEQAEELSLPAEGPGSLLRDGNRVLVEAHFDRGAAAGADDLRAAGAQVIGVSPRYQTVTVAAKPAELRELSSVPRVAGVSLVLTPIASASTCPAGVAVSEGDSQLHAAEARQTSGVDGTGVTVGILSDSFDRATEAADESGPVATHESDDVKSGDLPGSQNTCPGQATPVAVLDDSETKGEDEGRAMGQIVHDLAPGADLAFASAFNGLTAFAGNVKALALAGSDVIVDDVSYFEEPFFQEGPVGVAVKEVTEDGVSYFSSAGNNNLINAGRDIASWEALAYRNAGGCPSGAPIYAQECMDFNPGAGVDTTFGIRVSPGATLRVDLQWAQPWNGVKTDLDAYLLNSSNEVLEKSEEFNVALTHMPFEFVAWENTSSEPQTVQLAINRCSSSCDDVSGGDASSPRLKIALLQNGGGVTETEYPQSAGGDTVGPTIFGHNGAKDAISVAAIRFSASETPEKYSSRGPVTHLFGPVNGATPAAPLPEEEVLSKPDVTASDCVATTFFASFVSKEATWRFCGTSAAAPHAAAVAALMLDEAEGSLPTEISTALIDSATPLGTANPCAVGAGLVDAVGAIERLLLPEPASKPPCPPPEQLKAIEQGGSEPAAIPVAPVIQPPIEAPVDTREARPGTFLSKRPARTIRTAGAIARAVFVFGSDEQHVIFLCKIDRGRFHACPARFVRSYPVGKHVLRVKARNASGATDSTPAVFSFRVIRLPGA